MAPTTPPNLNQIDMQDEADAREGIEDVMDDGATGAADEGGESGEGDAPQPRQRNEPVLPPGVAKRLAITDNYVRGGVRPFDGDLTRNENVYGDVADENLEVDPDAPEPGVPPAQQEKVAPAPAPRMIQLKIRGKVVEMSEDEVIARAQKVEAADSYLEESRKMLEESARIRAERTGQDPQHPEGQTRTQDDGQDSDQPDQRRTHGPDLKAVIEQIQFGDPDKAAEVLAEAIQKTATTAANEGHVQRLLSSDVARSKLELQAFRDANQDLDKDPIASGIVERMIYDVYRDEIKGLGMDESQIPADPKTLADWHRFYRVNGHNVSKTSDVLIKAKDRYQSWRGDSPANNEQPKDPPRKEAPRVAVNVDRTERRQAIPQQPTRAVAPRRNEAPTPTPEQSRKSAVADMRRARGQPIA